MVKTKAGVGKDMHKIQLRRGERNLVLSHE